MNSLDGQIVLDLLVVARPGVDVQELLAETYSDVLDEFYGGTPGADDIKGSVRIRWSGPLGSDATATAWRVSMDLGNPAEIEDEFESEVNVAIIDGVIDLARQTDSGVLSVLKLADPVQLHGHTALYREVYGVEMALREVVSFIFAVQFPNNLIDGLAKTCVKPASSENLPQDDQLIKHAENRFFYILFNKYAILNDPPDLKAGHISEALTGATNFDEVRDALDLRPIKNEHHGGFLASLQTLMDPLEKVRNAVAHNRTVPQKVRDNFHAAVRRLTEEVDSFWKREAENAGTGE